MLEEKKYTVLTGAAGFIGSFLAGEMNQAGESNLVLVDDFTQVKKEANYLGKDFLELVNRDDFFAWVKGKEDQIEGVLHMGARTDTAEFDLDLLNRLNLHYSQSMWELCSQFAIPLIYASSAATYGGGEHGFDDSHSLPYQFEPLNPYGISKNDFDKWALGQSSAPPFWAGLKFFNVYGPNEYHKGRMASVVYHTFNQIRETGKMKLFRSHNPDFANGEQLRDFIYVADVARVIRFLRTSKPENGLYNLGTGLARSFNELASSVFHSLGLTPKIEYIDTPIDIRDKYQYFTQANTSKLRKVGYSDEFFSLKEGVHEYVEKYLQFGTIM